MPLSPNKLIIFGIAIGYQALCISNNVNNNIGIGNNAGCAILTGANNTVIGSLPGAAGCVCTVLIGAGACERIRVNDTGLYINNTLMTSGGGATISTTAPSTSTNSAGALWWDSSVGSMKVLYNNGGVNIWVDATAVSTGYTGSSGVGVSASPTVLGGVFGYTTGLGNTAIGCCAGNTTMTGANNIAIGCCALISNTTGGYNVAIGGSTLCANTTGINNVAIGYNALQCNTTGTDNVAIGCNALRCNTGGAYNIALGQSALCLNTTGINNVAIGCQSGSGLTTGACNVLIGSGAGGSITTGANNTVIGSLPAAAGCVCTVLIGAGTCERLKVDDSGLYVSSYQLFDATNQTLNVTGTNAEIVLTGITAEPTAASTGQLKIYAKSIAGRMQPKWVGPSGIDQAMQSTLAENKIAYFLPTGGSVTTSTVGFNPFFVQGTITARAVAATNQFTRTRRLGYVTALTASAVAGHYEPYAQYTVGSGDPAVGGGFYYVTRFGMSDAQSQTSSTVFVGLSSSVAAATTATPASLINIIGVGGDSTGQNLKMYYGGSAAQTAIDLGTYFPKNGLSTTTYELIMFSPTSSSSTVYYRVSNLTASTSTSGTLTAATVGTQLPLPTTFLAHRAYRGLGAQAVAQASGIDIISVYIETDY